MRHFFTPASGNVVIIICQPMGSHYEQEVRIVLEQEV